MAAYRYESFRVVYQRTPDGEEFVAPAAPAPALNRALAVELLAELRRRYPEGSARMEAAA